MFGLHLFDLSIAVLFVLTIKYTAGAPAAPTNVRVSPHTCTSVTVSWNGVNGATAFSVEWMLINDRSRTASGMRTASASITSITLTRLFQSSQYTVEVTSIRNGVTGGSTPVTFTTGCTGGLDINDNNNDAPSNVRVSEVTSSSAVVLWDIVDNVNEYRVEWRMLNEDVTMITDITGGINRATLNDLEPNTQYAVSVSSIGTGVESTSADIIFVTDSLVNPTEEVNPTEPVDQMNSTAPVDQMNSTASVDQMNSTAPVDQMNSTAPVDQMNSTASVDQVNSTQSTDQMNSTKTVIHTIECNGTMLVAPVNLTAQIVSSQMLIISWSYPSALLTEITFEVTYNLVSAYNTSAGMKSFAEYDKFNTTKTSFQFALISSVTNYIFTIAPYNAIYAGDSAKIVVDDFSQVDLVEDPVIFFNLRLGSRTANSLSSSDVNKINSKLTRLIQSSINDACQCILPSYTLRGSVDSCDRSQSNCAIYTGRLLGSDTASATGVFEMVEEWLATQNGSLLNGTLSVDPDCPLRLPSPSDTACSIYTWKNISSPWDNVDDNTSELTLAQLLLITVASGVITVIICSIIIVSALCVCISHRPKKDDIPTSSIYAQPQVKEDDQRHYSIVVQKNQSYNHALSNYKPNQNHNSELQNTYTNGNFIGSYSDPQQVTQSTYTTVQPKRPRNASEITSAEYEEIYSSGEYCNVDDVIPDPLSVSYLSITQT